MAVFTQVEPDADEGSFLAAHQEAADSVAGLLEEAFEQGGSPEERIRCGLRAVLQLCADEPDIARTLVVESLSAGPSARARRAATLEQLADLLAGPLAALGADERLATLWARSVVGCLLDAAYGPIERGETEGVPGLADEIVATYVAPAVPVGG